MTTIKVRAIMSVEKVLAAMAAAGKPVKAGELVDATGLDRKEVDKAMNQLKKEGKIVSPVRCAWEPAK
ncbi:hypothetical protein [Mangrovibacterium sp.]|uniref:hypothetical protein n=1 Tax=Mangrovibacterium sp. TaxID=1961364 RepID=UPI0035662CD9